MPSQKPRCALSECKKIAQLLTGKCDWCCDTHCASHRMPEDHKCIGLDDIKAVARDRNGEKLKSEVTGPAKGM